MAKLRFPGKALKLNTHKRVRFRGSYIANTPEDAYTKQIRRGLDLFRTVFGESDEGEDDFEGFGEGNRSKDEGSSKTISWRSSTSSKPESRIENTVETMVSQGLVTRSRVNTLGKAVMEVRHSLAQKERVKQVVVESSTMDKNDKSTIEPIKKKVGISSTFQTAKRLLARAKKLPPSNVPAEKSPKKFILPSKSVRSSRIIKPNKRLFDDITDMCSAGPDSELPPPLPTKDPPPDKEDQSRKESDQNSSTLPHPSSTEPPPPSPPPPPPPPLPPPLPPPPPLSLNQSVSPLESKRVIKLSAKGKGDDTQFLVAPRTKMKPPEPPELNVMGGVGKEKMRRTISLYTESITGEARGQVGRPKKSTRRQEHEVSLEAVATSPVRDQDLKETKMKIEKIEKLLRSPWDGRLKQVVSKSPNKSGIEGEELSSGLPVSPSCSSQASKTILRKARLTINKRTLQRIRSPMSLKQLGTPEEEGDGVGCKLCGAPEAIRQKHNLVLCEVCKKFVNCVTSGSDGILECCDGKGSCTLEGKEEMDRCQACWLKRLLVVGQLPNVLHDKLRKSLPQNIRDTVATSLARCINIASLTTYKSSDIVDKNKQAKRLDPGGGGGGSGMFGCVVDLPGGWKRKMGPEVVVVSPDGMRFKSVPRLVEYLKRQGISADAGVLFGGSSSTLSSGTQENYSRSSSNARTNKVVMTTLPGGWTRRIKWRHTGGRFDTYVYSPDGRTFRSRKELSRYFEQIGKVDDIHKYFPVATGHSDSSVGSSSEATESSSTEPVSSSEPCSEMSSDERSVEVSECEIEKNSSVSLTGHVIKPDKELCKTHLGKKDISKKQKSFDKTKDLSASDTKCEKEAQDTRLICKILQKKSKKALVSGRSRSLSLSFQRNSKEPTVDTTESESETVSSPVKSQLVPNAGVVPQESIEFEKPREVSIKMGNEMKAPSAPGEEKERKRIQRKKKREERVLKEAGKKRDERADVELSKNREEQIASVAESAKKREERVAVEPVASAEISSFVAAPENVDLGNKPEAQEPKVDKIVLKIPKKYARQDKELVASVKEIRSSDSDGSPVEKEKNRSKVEKEKSWFKIEKEKTVPQLEKEKVSTKPDKVKLVSKISRTPERIKSVLKTPEKRKHILKTPEKVKSGLKTPDNSRVVFSVKERSESENLKPVCSDRMDNQTSDASMKTSDGFDAESDATSTLETSESSKPSSAVPSEAEPHEVEVPEVPKRKLKAKTRKQKSGKMFHFGQGWARKVVWNEKGEGRVAYLHSPDGQTFRSRIELMAYMKKAGKKVDLNYYFPPVLNKEVTDPEVSNTDSESVDRRKEEEKSKPVCTSTALPPSLLQSSEGSEWSDSEHPSVGKVSEDSSTEESRGTKVLVKKLKTGREARIIRVYKRDGIPSLKLLPNTNKLNQSETMQSSLVSKVISTKSVSSLKVAQAKKKLACKVSPKIIVVKTGDSSPTKAEEFDSGVGEGIGPRVKHVCRSQAQVLGMPRAVFPSPMKEEPKEEKHSKLLPSSNIRFGKPSSEVPITVRGKVLRKTQWCGKCAGCVTLNCRKCANCRDMKKYGGPGTKKKPCIMRKCQNPRLSIKSSLNTDEKTKAVVQVGKSPITVVPSVGVKESPKTTTTTTWVDKQTGIQEVEGVSRAQEKGVFVPRQQTRTQPDPKDRGDTMEGKQYVPGAMVNIDYWQGYDVEEMINCGYPVLTSSSLDVQALCFRCGAAGKEPLLYCAWCCEGLHPYCLEEGEGPENEQEESFWCCRRCATCHVCGALGADSLLRCSDCRQYYHMECLGPSAHQTCQPTPERSWEIDAHQILKGSWPKQTPIYSAEPFSDRSIEPNVLVYCEMIPLATVDSSKLENMEPQVYFLPREVVKSAHGSEKSLTFFDDYDSDEDSEDRDLQLEDSICLEDEIIELYCNVDINHGADLRKIRMENLVTLKDDEYLCSGYKKERIYTNKKVEISYYRLLQIIHSDLFSTLGFATWKELLNRRLVEERGGPGSDSETDSASEGESDSDDDSEIDWEDVLEIRRHEVQLDIKEKEEKKREEEKKRKELERIQAKLERQLEMEQEAKEKDVKDVAKPKAAESSKFKPVLKRVGTQETIEVENGSESKPLAKVKKKRGRPPGSKNKVPKNPEDKKIKKPRKKRMKTEGGSEEQTNTSNGKIPKKRGRPSKKVEQQPGKSGEKGVKRKRKLNQTLLNINGTIDSVIKAFMDESDEQSKKKVECKMAESPIVFNLDNSSSVIPIENVITVKTKKVSFKGDSELQDDVTLQYDNDLESGNEICDLEISYEGAKSNIVIGEPGVKKRRITDISVEGCENGLPSVVVTPVKPEEDNSDKENLPSLIMAEESSITLTIDEGMESDQILECSASPSESISLDSPNLLNQTDTRSDLIEKRSRREMCGRASERASLRKAMLDF